MQRGVEVICMGEGLQNLLAGGRDLDSASAFVWALFLMFWHQRQSIPSKSPQSCWLCSFCSTTLYSIMSLSTNVFGYSRLWTDCLFSCDFCVSLCSCGLSRILLSNVCQVVLPHYCVGNDPDWLSLEITNWMERETELSRRSNAVNYSYQWNKHLATDGEKLVYVM